MCVCVYKDVYVYIFIFRVNQLLTAANSSSCFGIKAVSTLPFLKSCDKASKLAN